MHELQLAPQFHFAVPDGDEPEALFLLTVGLLGDAAAAVANNQELDAEATNGLGFAANFFDAFLSSRFRDGVSRDLLLLASAAYYIADRPGSSFVLARKLRTTDGELAPETLLRKALRSEWQGDPIPAHPLYDGWLNEVASVMTSHLAGGAGAERLNEILNWIRHLAYRSGTPRDLLFIDLTAALVRKRLKSSSWNNLPEFSGLPREAWAPAIAKPEFPNELWPSQILLGEKGFFSGGSGIIQMPTSAGKTRSIEIILRSGFLSNRTRLAVIVAPFRALCHEIAAGFRNSFSGEDVSINELTDVLQTDFLDVFSALFGEETPTRKSVLVITPEKFLYILRQSPTLVNDIGIVVYDEAHQFDSGSRGVTYELLLTEIRAMLSAAAQTVLVSAVIRNGRAVADWLIGPEAEIADGTSLLPTKRSIAFASWIERLGQLIFYDGSNFENFDYFVPRVIEPTVLTLFGRERNPRSFPEKNEANDIALYFGIRLAPMGAVAVFCGTKATASGIANRAVDIYKRGYHVVPPSAVSDPREIEALHHLITENFGRDSGLAKAALLGVFVHHGNTPQGIRLCVEHAMQKGRIKLVACTSTLAQGVNLPIRYLIACGTRQGGEPIKVRDFQNLMGRAGRAAMHTEGLVIFADPTVYDRRGSQFTDSVNLLSPQHSEETTSSLLGVISPIKSRWGYTIDIAWQDVRRLVFSTKEDMMVWAEGVERVNAGRGYNAKEILKELLLRRKILASVESYLMANRGGEPFTAYRASVERLAQATLAFHLANDAQRDALVGLFTTMADYLEEKEAVPEKQASYAKTLLGIQAAKGVEDWVAERPQEFGEVRSNADWLRVFWPLLVANSDDKFFHAVTPEGFGFELAERWLNGEPYQRLIGLTTERGAKKPVGTQMHRLAEDDVIKFCETILGFDCSLILAAAIQFFRDGENNDEDVVTSLLAFQKALKYGLPDQLSVSIFEYGFADRVVAQKLAEALRDAGFDGSRFASALEPYRALIDQGLIPFPIYFKELLSAY